jgi:hypothetical protein
MHQSQNSSQASLDSSSSSGPVKKKRVSWAFQLESFSDNPDKSAVPDSPVPVFKEVKTILKKKDQPGKVSEDTTIIEKKELPDGTVEVKTTKSQSVVLFDEPADLKRPANGSEALFAEANATTDEPTLLKGEAAGDKATTSGPKPKKVRKQKKKRKRNKNFTLFN